AGGDCGFFDASPAGFALPAAATPDAAGFAPPPAACALATPPRRAARQKATTSASRDLAISERDGREPGDVDFNERSFLRIEPPPLDSTTSNLERPLIVERGVLRSVHQAIGVLVAPLQLGLDRVVEHGVVALELAAVPDPLELAGEQAIERAVLG